ncbi:fimbrial chaperone [Escherichia coli DEC2A]|nr:fimbrial chaperone [Escherichia coli DEC2A]
MIYDGNKKEASLTVQNKNKSEEFLIQSWVDDATGSKKHHSSLLRHYSNLSQEKQHLTYRKCESVLTSGS